MDDREGFFESIENLSKPAEQLGLLDVFVEDRTTSKVKEVQLESSNQSETFRRSDSSSELPAEIKSKSVEDKPARTLAPMLLQYKQVKGKYPEHLLLFQVGDFYEVFFDDARLVSSVLNIRLTSRDKDQVDPIPMCGVPIHALESYLPKLLQAGYSCVLVSQVEDAKNAKGMVRREITRIVTPGVRYEGDGLDQKQFNYLFAVCFGGGQAGACAFVDVSIGTLRVQETEQLDELVELLRRVRPAEVILPSSLFGASVEQSRPILAELKRNAKDLNSRVVYRPFEREQREVLEKRLSSLLPPGTSSSLSLSKSVEQISPIGACAVSVLLSYVEDVSFGNVPKLAAFHVEEQEQAVFIDTATRRNLEILETRIDGEKKNSLLNHLDYTSSGMGSRLLTEWLIAPSKRIDDVLARHDAVQELINSDEVLSGLRTAFTGVRDLDRLMSRITGGRAVPRDLGALLDSIRVLPQIKQLLSRLQSGLIKQLASQFDDLLDVKERLDLALVDEPPAKLTEGGIFRKGFSPDIDRLQGLRDNGHLWLLELEAKERQRTGVSNLKVRFNNLFGYFIELSKSQLSKVPADYERKQTLANAERFVTKELKDYEVQLLSAKARQFELERELFLQLRSWTAEHAGRIQLTAHCISQLDVLASFAYLAKQHNYTRPKMTSDQELRIVGGRHPVVERVLGSHNFVPNDTLLNCGERRFAILTGPNMGGKSTYLRQIALIQLLAQAGSFVPAQSAQLGMVDRIFTRIGAADDLSRGDSTFMVEMREAATILRRATNRSLVLIDEIGRGTATTDGLAIALAISEWLHDCLSCRTVFATHFHELTKLAEEKSGAFCLAVGVLEKDKEIVFTHRIEEKTADRSYGIEVARLAGLPEPLLLRAEAILVELENHTGNLGKADFSQFLGKAQSGSAVQSRDNRSFELLQRLRERFYKLNPDAITPLRALHELAELKHLIEE